MANNKWGKKLLGLVAVGAAVGGVIAYLNKKNNCCNSEDEFSDDFENEDFDLDEDLKEAASREYVSLTPDTSSDTESDEEVQPEEENVSDEEVVSSEETEQSDNE
ncbi:MAG: hypothetical protein Q4B89_00750 [Lachnospiraceae bacterium]|nr:hypothetical protein [Lachnospiraceae bacterium]